jgi:hypothetical protein
VVPWGDVDRFADGQSGGMDAGAVRLDGEFLAEQDAESGRATEEGFVRDDPAAVLDRLGGEAFGSDERVDDRTDGPPGDVDRGDDLAEDADAARDHFGG